MVGIVRTDSTQSEAGSPVGTGRGSAAAIRLPIADAADRGALLIWAALLILSAGAVHAIGLLDQPPGSIVLLTLVAGLGAIQIATALAVLVRSSRAILVVATVLAGVSLGLWVLVRVSGIPLGPTTWRPETLGSMDDYLPGLEGIAAIFFLALVGRTLPAGKLPRTILTALPWVLGAALLVLALTHQGLATILLVALFTGGYTDGLTNLFVPAVVLLVVLLVLRRVSPGLRARTPRAGRTTLQLLPALLVTSLLTTGAASTAADRPWLSTSAVVTAPPGQTSTLAYCNPEGNPLAMDLTEPVVGAARPAPVVLYIHGGEGLVGDRVLQGDEGPYLAHLRDDLVGHGLVVGSIDYDLAPGYHLADEVEDARCAVRFLRANARTLGIDPRRIGVYGDSEGGYLSAMLGTTGSEPGGDVGQYASQSSTVQAVVDMWGFTDLTNWSGSPSWVSVLGAGLGAGTSTSSPARAKEESPLYNVAPGDPPFLIIHGTDDWFIAPHHSQDLARRLQAAGVPATLVMVQHGGHGLASPTAGYAQQPGPEAIVHMIASFFEQELGH